MGDGGFSQQRSVHKDLRAAVARAIAAGWTATKGKTKGWTLRSPDGTAHFYVPITTKDGTTAAKRLNKLITDSASQLTRWTPGMNPQEVEEVVKEVNSRGGTINHGPDATISCKQCPEEFTDWDGFAAHVNEKHPVAQPEEEPPVVEEVVVIPRPRPGFHTAVKAIAEARENPASGKMHDMEEAMQETLRPWRAIKERNEVEGTVLTYASSAVLEVVVDGKVITHKCAACEYRHLNPKSVVSHHARHVARGEVKPKVETDHRTEPAEKYPLVISKGPYVHARDEQEEAMYQAIHGRHQGKTEADSVYARALVERLNAKGWVVSKSGEVGNPEDTDTLDKIKALLGWGDNLGRAADLQLELDQAMEALVQKEAELLEVTKSREDLQGFVNTLGALAQEKAKQ